MALISRRRFLGAAGVSAAATLALSGYATAYEAGYALDLTQYTPHPPQWPADLPLKIAVIADIHACYPWMSEARIGEIVDLANAEKPDLIVLLGDFVCTHRYVSGYVPPGAWADELARLEAPLGVYAILGNHDWWFAAIPTDPPDNSRSIRRALAQARVPVLENQSSRLASAAARSGWSASAISSPSGGVRPSRRRRRSAGGATRTRRRRAGDPPRPRAFRLSSHARPRRADALRPHARRPGQFSDYRAAAGAHPRLQHGLYLRPIFARRSAIDRLGGLRHVLRADPFLEAAGSRGRQSRGRAADGLSRLLASHHHDVRADMDAVEEIDDVEVAHADAARRNAHDRSRTARWCRGCDRACRGCPDRDRARARRADCPRRRRAVRGRYRRGIPASAP